MPEREIFTINCACTRTHTAVVGVEYEFNPFAAGYNSSKVPITLNYTCPTNSTPREVTFYFTTNEAKEFKNARIIEIQN